VGVAVRRHEWKLDSSCQGDDSLGARLFIAITVALNLRIQIAPAKNTL
jgi:hypothetical protein